VVDAIAHALKAVDLSEHRHRRVGHFSGGMKRRLSLAIALVESPRVVYLDEPTTGIDPASRMIVWKAIREVRCQPSRTRMEQKSADRPSHHVQQL
jgi:ABC-2 type transport system ATP-binding protein